MAEDINALRDVFNLFDGNGDGEISLKELGDLAKEFKMGLTEEEIMAMIEKADKNFDGQINFEEFKHLIGEFKHRK
ncbi:MAG: EF-hand domain-containing protein [Candidatus Heimdallarchaeota archaeon]|nr:EF-hand domain-containing protein [Candidatus Heimdallarchaeota archaeon]